MTEAERENADLRRRIAQLEGTIADVSRPRDPSEADELARLQARADGVATAFGERAPTPSLGETPLAYRRRLLQDFQKHSPSFRGMSFATADVAVLEAAESRVYADAQAAGRASNAASGRLVAREESDGSGRRITRYDGDILEFMRPFMSGASVGRINRSPNPPARVVR